MSDLLRSYVVAVILEMKKKAAGVPSQLVGAPKGAKSSEEEKEEVEEMSVAANVAGMTLPLGMKTKGKKNKPGWK